MVLLLACASPSPAPSVRLPLDGDLPADDGNWNVCACDHESRCLKRHLGVDLVARAGTLVFPVEPGEVLFLGGPDQADGWGKGLRAVFVRHGQPGSEYVAVYGHLWARVEVGDVVAPERPLGAIGTYYEERIGRTLYSANHLHFGIHLGPDVPRGPTGRVFDLGCVHPENTLGFVAPLSFVRARRDAYARALHVEDP